MRTSFIILLSVVCALCFSCKVRTPKGIPSESKMENLLYDYHRAQSMADSKDSADYKLCLYTDAVLAKYDLSHDDFDSIMKWYSRHADKLYKVYEKVNQRLDNEAQVYGASPNLRASGKYTNVATTGDTANIWRSATEGLLIPKAGHNIFSFRIVNDSICKPKDKFEWNFNTQFIYQSGRKNAVAVMAVRYENDSVTSVQQQLYGNMDNTLVLSAANLPIKQIEGFIYLEEPLDSKAKLLFLSKFVLVRFHNTEKRDSIIISNTDSTAVKGDSSKVMTEKEKQEFIDSIQNTANGDRQGDHFRTAPRRRAMPREKILPR